MWKTVKLGDVIEKTETINPTSKFPNNSFEYIDVSSVSKERLAIEETQTLLGKDAPSRARRRVLEDDVIFATVRPTLKRVAVVPRELNEQICSTGYIVLRGKKDVLLPRYLFHWMTSQFVMDYVEAVQTGASYPAVTDKQVREINIRIPPLAEQQRIVAKLDAAFAEIDRATAVTAEQLANVPSVFTQYLSKISAPLAPLGDIINIKTGKLNANAMEEDGIYPFFTCSREAYRINSYAFECDAVLLAGNNAAGEFNVKHYNGKFNAYQRTYVLTVKDSNQLRSRYLYFQLINVLKKFKALSVGSGTRFLKLGMIQDMQIPVPTFGEQEKVLSKLDRLKDGADAVTATLTQKANNLRSLKSAILAQELQPPHSDAA